MPNPLEAAYANTADPKYQLLDEIREKGAERTAAWKRFSEERDAVGEAGLYEDEAAVKRLEDLNAAYTARSDELKALEDRLQTYSDHPMLAADAPGVQEKAWARGTVSKLIQAKALDATSGGTIPAPFFDASLRNLPSRNLFVRSVLPTQTVDSDKVWYLRQTVRTNNAAPVATGAVKPTSVFSVERLEATVRTIAHISEAVDRALLADFARLTDFLSAELRLGVLLSEEDEILNGSGTAPHLRGILNTSGILTQARGTDIRSDAILKGLNAVRITGLFEPDAIVLHPTDYQTVVLEKDSNGNYIHGSSNDATTPTLWGKRVITSPALTQGTGLVGAFGEGAVIYDREQPRVDFSDSHSDLFSRNQILFRGEERLAFAVTRPSAFATITSL